MKRTATAYGSTRKGATRVIVRETQALIVVHKTHDP